MTDETTKQKIKLSLAKMIEFDAHRFFSEKIEFTEEVRKTLSEVSENANEASQILMLGIKTIGRLLWMAATNPEEPMGNAEASNAGMLIEELAEMLQETHDIESGAKYAIKYRTEKDREKKRVA